MDAVRVLACTHVRVTRAHMGACTTAMYVWVREPVRVRTVTLVIVVWRPVVHFISAINLVFTAQNQHATELYDDSEARSTTLT